MNSQFEFLGEMSYFNATFFNGFLFPQSNIVMQVPSEDGIVPHNSLAKSIMKVIQITVFFPSHVSKPLR